jgi:hypothetical protein
MGKMPVPDRPRACGRATADDPLETLTKHGSAESAGHVGGPCASTCVDKLWKRQESHCWQVYMWSARKMSGGNMLTPGRRSAVIQIPVDFKLERATSPRVEKRQQICRGRHMLMTQRRGHQHNRGGHVLTGFAPLQPRRILHKLSMLLQ